METKLINVGTEDYLIWVPAGRAAVYGQKAAALDDAGNLILMRSRIIYHDGSGHNYDSPLPASQVVKLMEDGNGGIPGVDNYPD